MAEPRLFQRQQFDLIRCKLCNKLYDEPRLLDCLHSFCTGCLQAYVSKTTDNTVTCPTCQESTNLPENGIQGIMLNTLLIRFIEQAQKDKTTVVAGREVLHMTQEALTESELKCPEIVASVQEIANTAGYVLADNFQDSDIQTDIETTKARQAVQGKMTELQMKVMDIVHSIDKVNQRVHDWEHKKTQVKNAIKQRSMEIQDGIRSIERRLISQLEDRDTHSEMKDEAFSVKSKLHQSLRSSLGLVDFLRLVTEFGNKEELEKYSCLATARKEKMYNKKIYITENSFTFNQPNTDLDEALEMMFGNLSEVTEENVAWDPNKLTYQSHTGNAPEGHLSAEFVNTDTRTEPKLTKLNYTEINEIRDMEEKMNSNTSMSDRLNKRQFPGNQVKVHRRPIKSMSFDASLPSSPYHYITSQNQDLQQKLLHAQDSNIQPQFKVLNEHVIYDDSGSQENNVRSQTPVQAAMHSLEESSKYTGPVGHSSMSRRLSAPPSILIDTLNRRRLSALSILERANINTEGLRVTSDIESGMNEARLEWLRENVRKKAERRASQEEDV